MNPKVWQASGHIETFSDPLVECKKCHHRFRADKIDGKKCPDCGGQLTGAKQFNLMLKTFLGPVEDLENTVYFRPEIAQAMFVDFKNVLDTTRRKLPFGIASEGKAFRNEITPGNFIFRTREFNLMEFEYFVEEKDWGKMFDYWQKEMWAWATDNLGIEKKNLHDCECEPESRAHYSKKTVDLEYDYPFGRDELYGLAYRTDFDLKNHFKEPPYEDTETGEKFYPHVIEPTFGLDRSVLAVLCDAYTEEKERIVLKLKPSLAPYKVAVFPLLRNKPELVKKAQEVYHLLKKNFNVAFDDRGNIGKRYYSQDEIGTPFCVTIDFETLENDDVTIRDRDTMKQERVKISDLVKRITGIL
jgi:glycyl-tRNA synthetase